MGHIGGEGLDGVDAAIKRFCHVAQSAREVADFVFAVGEVGNFGAVVHAPAHLLRRAREAADGLGDLAGQRHRQEDGDENGDQKGEENDAAFGFQNLVDLAAMGGEHQRAQNRLVALDGHGDGDDDLALLVDPHHGHRGAGQGGGDFGKLPAILQPVFLLQRVMIGKKPLVQAVPQAGQETLLGLIERRKIEAQNAAIAIEMARIHRQDAFTVIDARRGSGGFHQTAQHGAGLFGADEKIETGKIIQAAGGLFVRLLHELVWINGDLAGVDAGRGGHGGGHDMGLGHERLDARVDEAFARLVEVENAANQNDQTGQIDENDARQQGRGAQFAQPVQRAARGLFVRRIQRDVRLLPDLVIRSGAVSGRFCSRRDFCSHVHQRNNPSVRRVILPGSGILHHRGFRWR